jgi:nuclear mRNA export protein SAC3
MNPDVDSTAIWLEKKFHVPESGTWASNQVFSIPLVEKSDTQEDLDCPGLIMFECTPMDGMTDEIER